MCQLSFISKPLQGFITFALKKVGISQSIGAAAFWSMVESFSAPFFSLMLMPILTHNLGLANYGVYVMAMAFIALSGFTGFGMNTAITYHLAKNSANLNLDYNKNTAQQLTTALTITLIGTAGFATLFLSATYLSQGYLKINHPQWLTYDGLKIQVVLLLIFTQCDMVISAALKGLQHFKTSALCELLIRLVGFALLTAAAFYYKQVEIIIGVAVLVSALSLIIRLVVMLKTADLKINDMRYNINEAKIFFNFGKWMTLQNISGAIFGSIDKLVLGAFYGTALVGIYNILLTLAQLVHFCTASVLSFIMPKIALNNNILTNKKIIKIFSITTALSLLMSIILVLLMPLVFSYFKLSDQYKNAFYLLIFCYFLLSLNVPSYFMALGMKLIKAISLQCIVGAGVGIIALFLNIESYGIYAAIGSKFIYSLFALLLILPILNAVNHRND